MTYDTLLSSQGTSAHHHPAFQPNIGATSILNFSYLSAQRARFGADSESSHFIARGNRPSLAHSVRLGVRSSPAGVQTLRCHVAQVKSRCHIHVKGGNNLRFILRCNRLFLDSDSTHSALSATEYEPFTVKKVPHHRTVPLVRDPFVIEGGAPLADGPTRLAPA